MGVTADEKFLTRSVNSEDDVRRLVEFNSEVHSQSGEPDPRLGVYVADLLEPGLHPTVTWDDYFLVEDPASGEIASSLMIIPQTWEYAGIPFGVGRIEMVGTRPEYRRRGLVREQFNAAHARCEALGLPVQAITGIAHYYRQFGYDYMLEIGGGQRIALGLIPETPEDSPYHLRLWQEADLPALEALYARQSRGKLVICQRPASHWRYLFRHDSPDSVEHRWLYVIARADEVIGYAAVAADTLGPLGRITELVLNGPYPEIIPWLAPRLRDEFSVLFAGRKPDVKLMYFHFSSQHPVYPYLQPYFPAKRRPYAWYIRVPDTAGLVRLIAPELDRRIAEGTLAGLTRSLALNFYNGGLRLDFERGRLVDAKNLPRGVDMEDSIPQSVFLQLLFGYRSLGQLARIYLEVEFSPETDRK